MYELLFDFFSFSEDGEFLSRSYAACGLLFLYVVFELLSKRSEEVKSNYFVRWINTFLACYLLFLDDFIRVFVVIQLITLISFSVMTLLNKVNNAVQVLKLYIVNSFFDGILLFGIFFFYLSTGTFSFESYKVHNHEQFLFAIVLLVIYIVFRLGIILFERGVYKLIKNIRYECLVGYYILPLIAIIIKTMMLCNGLLDQLSPRYVEVFESFIVTIIVGNSIFTGAIGMVIKNRVKLASVVMANNASFVLFFILIDSEQLTKVSPVFILISYMLPVVGYLYFAVKNDKELSFCSNNSVVIKLFFYLFLASMASLPMTVGFSAKFVLLQSLFSSGFVLVTVVVVLSTMIMNYGIFNVFLSSFNVEKKEINIVACDHDFSKDSPFGLNQLKKYLGPGLVGFFVLFGGIILFIW